jgi:cytochrome P450
VIIRGFYNVFLHPLAKVPGPKLYAFTDIPYLYYLARGEWPYVLKGLHDRYGTTVRFAPDNVSSITVEGWKKIYGHKNDATKTFNKDMKGYAPSRTGYSQIINANDADHKRMRRLLAHAFSEAALRKQEDIIKPYVDLFISRMAEKARSKEGTDMVQWFNFTTFDLIGDLAFGEPFGGLKNGVYHPWVSMIFDNVHTSVLGEIIRRHPSLKALAAFIIPAKMRKHQEEHQELTKQTAMRRLDSRDTERADFMSYILRHSDEKGMSTGEVIENSGILIVAGSETTATMLSGTTFNLLMNPDAYAKVTSEIRAAFASEDEITMTSVNDLKYMLAVLEESFRMCE